MRTKQVHDLGRSKLGQVTLRGLRSRQVSGLLRSGFKDSV